MDRVAIFVDAGHLLKAGAVLVAGNADVKRNEIRLDIPSLCKVLQEQAQLLSSLPLLRIYWYDGMLQSGLTTEQQLLAAAPNLKLRLGVVNGHGEQKGVDARIVTDLTELSRIRAICDAVLVGGDEDLRIGVELAQSHGVRVHLLSVENSRVSELLRHEADTTAVLGESSIKSFLHLREDGTPAGQIASPTFCPAPAPTPAAVSPTAEDLTNITLAVRDYLTAISADDGRDLKAALGTSRKVPSEHDGKLLACARTSLGRPLSQPEKRVMREELRRQLGV